MSSTNHLGPMRIWVPSSFSCLGSKRTKKHFYRNFSLCFHTYEDLCIGFLLWSLLPHDEGFKRNNSWSTRLMMIVVIDYVFRIKLHWFLLRWDFTLLLRHALSKLWRCLLTLPCPLLRKSWTWGKFSFQKLVNITLY